MATWSEMREHLVQTYGLEEDLDRGAGRLKGFMPNGYGSDRLVLVHDTGNESTGDRETDGHAGQRLHRRRAHGDGAGAVHRPAAGDRVRW